MENKKKLPMKAELVLIKGGNHSQFGYLGQLLMDSSANISLEEQQKISFESLLKFITKINNSL